MASLRVADVGGQPVGYGDEGMAAVKAMRAKAYDGRGKKYPESFWRAEVERLEVELAQEGLRHV